MPRQPEARPTVRTVAPAAPLPEPRIVTRPSSTENNVYVTPDGNIMRNTSQGWQQRNQNTWKKVDVTPGKQDVIRDSNVRQRAAERSSTPRIAPAAKRSSDDKNRGR